MATASGRVEATVERSHVYESFTVDDETGKRIGYARTLFFAEGLPRYLRVELRGLFSHRNRIVPWELATLDEHKRRISLRCRKRDVEDAPNFYARDVFEPQARRVRTHFGLSAEAPDERVPEEPADQLFDGAETPQATV